jgi:formate--tetrahydrofolate ligase
VKTIPQLAEQLDIPMDLVLPYGHDKAKIRLDVLKRPRAAARRPHPKLILVSAITPTPAGEGKTTTTIGLADGLSRLGESVCVALREPSLGPCMGVKGGGTGGGRAQLVPSDDINLHFTGDFHAVTTANNLLAAVVDNQLHFQKEPKLDPRRILWRRVMDMNDRTLREIVVGLGGTPNGIPRQDGFDITAASEIMAILCLATDVDDLRARIEAILVGYAWDGTPVRAGQLGVAGAMLALLRDAFIPNLVQTQEGTPALVHGGPFANIAHGCNSIVATRTALHLADWAITEAGFGVDLGAEKFFDIKCRIGGFDPAAVVVVATLRALKMHGGKALDEIDTPNPEAVAAGLPNLEKQCENIRAFGKPPIVALNRHLADTEAEIDVVRKACARLGIGFAVAEHYAKGGEGALDLAKVVLAEASKPTPPFKPLYELDAKPQDKIAAVATTIYGAKGVIFSKPALQDLKEIEKAGYSRLPICMAKTQSSLSDDPKLRGRPTNFEITVRNVQVSAGAGFLVVLTGEMMRMPGLPKKPQSESIDLRDGQIVGLK